MELAEYAEFLVKSIVKNPDMIKVKTFGKDDENILENKVKLNEITKEELKIKLNKKVKLFI